MELLVALAIIAVLVGLVFIGVQAARESARRSACQSKLRQIGLAVLNYESTNHMLPFGHSRQGFSAHVMILPFIGEQPTYDRFDLKSGVDDPQNEAARANMPIAFICPSIGLDQRENLATSFCSNAGTGAYDGCNGTLKHWRDPITKEMQSPTKMSSITDGASNSALMSEAITILKADSRTALLWYSPRRNFDQVSYALFARQCYSQSGYQSRSSEHGIWIYGDPGASRYFHVLPPNSASCTNDGRTPELIFTSASRHPSGINSVYADSSVHWIANSIAVKVWRELGSRNNSESELLLH